MSDPRLALGAGTPAAFSSVERVGRGGPGRRCRATPAPPAATVSADTWAVVDGREITREDVDKAYRRARDASQTLSDEETLTAKLSLLNDLIVQDILLAKAAHAEARGAPSELDTAYAEREEEHAGRGLSAGADATRPDAGRHARRAPARAAHAEGHRAGSGVEGRGHGSGGHRLLQRQSRAVQHARRSRTTSRRSS